MLRATPLGTMGRLVIITQSTCVYLSCVHLPPIKSMGTLPLKTIGTPTKINIYEINQGLLKQTLELAAAASNRPWCGERLPLGFPIDLVGGRPDIGDVKGNPLRHNG